MIGAAWEAFKLLGIWGKIGGALAAAWAWAVKNPLAAALIAAVALLAWQHHTITGKNHKIATLTADQAVWAKVDQINHNTITGLINTLNDQSQHIRDWSKSALAKQEATQATLRAMESDNRAAQATASHIRAQADSAPTQDCKTHQAVLQGRDRL